jgi:competence protein ComEC
VLQLPGGETVLVDGGGFSDNRYFDVGQRIIAPFLWRQKIKTVDLMVLSHPNSDHLNGLLYILKHFKVREVWDNGEAVDTVGYRQWLRLIKERGISHPDFSTLVRHQSRRGVHLDILAPPADFQNRHSRELWRDTNNNSLVMKVRFGAASILLTGDIGKQAEAHILRAFGSDLLKCTILLAPHHGSVSSSSIPFIQAVSPQVTLISCGWMNPFGFPHPKVIHRLAAVDSRIWTTADSGAIQVVFNRSKYKIKTER